MEYGVYENDLFREYLKKNDIKKSQVIAKNLFCKLPGDEKMFESYFTFCTNLVSEESFSKNGLYQFLLSEAELALKIYAENCIMEEVSIKLIEKCNNILNQKIVLVNTIIDSEQKKSNDEAIETNNDIYKKLLSNIQQLKEHYSNFVARKISSLDNMLNKELLSAKQLEEYNKCSKELSEIVSLHIVSENKKYNSEALTLIKKVLDNFIDDSSLKKEKEREKLRSLLQENMFSFSQERLFPETLTYYNYVYSYIFSKLDNDGKKFITECAIMNKK